MAAYHLSTEKESNVMQYEKTMRETRQAREALWLAFEAEKTTSNAARAILAALDACHHEDASDSDDEEQRAISEGVALWMEGR
jgi:hypothetical protein